MSEEIKKLQNQILSTTGESLSTESLAIVLKNLKEWQAGQPPVKSQAAVMADIGGEFIGDSIVPYPMPDQKEEPTPTEPSQQDRFESLARPQELNTKRCLTLGKYHDVRTQAAWEMFQALDAQRNRHHLPEILHLKAKLLSLETAFEEATTPEDVREIFLEESFDDLVQSIEAEGLQKFRDWMKAKSNQYGGDLAFAMLDNILRMYLEDQYPGKTEVI